MYMIYTYIHSIVHAYYTIIMQYDYVKSNLSINGQMNIYATHFYTS